MNYDEIVANCKDFCVLKAFDLTDEEILECKNVIKVEGISLFFETNNLDSLVLLANDSASEEDFNDYLEEISYILKNKMYSDENVTLEDCVVSKAIEKNVSIAVAESLTGGLICSMLVNVPGSSKIFTEGFVTYSNNAKVRRLHVNISTLENYGAVSDKTAKEMVQGLLQNKDIKVGISTTGCAGPSGNDDGFEVPVGRAYIGIGDRSEINVKEVNFVGTRNEIRKCVANTALYMLLNYINDLGE